MSNGAQQDAIQLKIDATVCKAFADFAIHLDDLKQVAESRLDELELNVSSPELVGRINALSDVAIAARRIANLP